MLSCTEDGMSIGFSAFARPTLAGALTQTGAGRQRES